MSPEQAAAARHKLPLPEGEEVAVSVATDLLSDGTYGESWLVASAGRVLRLEPPAGARKFNGEVTVTGSWELSELRNFRFEELVDAGDLVADYQGQTIELLRGSAVVSGALVSAAKRLQQLAEGKALSDSEENKRLCPKCHRPLPKDSDVCDYCINHGKTLIRLMRFLKPYRWQVAASAVLLLAGTALALVPGMLIKILVDQVFEQHSRRLFLPVILGMAGSAVLLMGVTMLRGWINAWISNKVVVDIRAKLFEHLQALSLAFFDRRTVGSVMSRMTNDTGALYEVLVDGIPFLLRDVLILTAIPVALFIVDWQVAFFTLLPIPAIMYLVKVFRRRIMRVWRRFWHSWSRLSGALNGVLTGMRVVKAFRGEDREVVRFTRRVQNLADLGYSAETAWSIFFPMIVMLVSIGTILAYYIGGERVIGGEMSTGEFFLFVTYLTQMQAPMQTLTRLIDWTSRALTASERVFEVMDTIPDIQQPREPVKLGRYEGRITFENVRFGYEKAHEVLHGIDLEVSAGETIGIVGHSGSGKTTLMSLLLRFYDPTEGSIKVDGLDTRELDLEEFRKNVGTVPQESFLFPGSIQSNIAYGRPEASLEEIMAAAKAANAHDFIMRFPDGYDTYVGERGQRLSGGERQRIAIARAILHNPRILILDEATSSVDTETERMIQQALANLVEGRTAFAIAHRLSTLRNADRIVVMQDGTIAEIGTHDELMRHSGVYKKLVDMQADLARVRADFLDLTDVEESELQ